jgi:DNA-binding transcriptional LysR family regulator
LGHLPGILFRKCRSFRLRRLLEDELLIRVGKSYELSAWASSLLETLETVGVDLVLLPDPIPTRLPRERLYDEEWVCVVDAENRAVGDVLRLEDLVRLPHVVFDMAGVALSA